MPVIGDFIGNYRILAQLSFSPDCALYAVEYTISTRVPMLLISCSTLFLLTDDEKNRFQQKLQAGNIEKNGQLIAIQDAGVADQHPYFVVAYTNDTQHAMIEHTRFVGQVLASTRSLHPNDQKTLFEAFLQVAVNAAKTETGTRPAEPVQDEEDTEKTHVVRPSARQSSISGISGSSYKNISQDEEKTVLSSPFVSQSGPAQDEEKTMMAPPPVTQSGATYGAPLVDERTVITPPPPTITPLPPVNQSNFASSDERTVATPLPPVNQSGFGYSAPSPVNQSGFGYSAPPYNNASTGEANSAPYPYASNAAYASGTMGSTPNRNTSDRPAFERPKRQLKKWQIVVAAVVLLVLLIGGGSWLHTIIPAETATVSITPTKTDFSHTYTLTVTSSTTETSSGYTGGNVPVPGRLLSSTSQQQAQTVTVTGHGTHPAISAKGTIIISQIHLTDPSPTGNSLDISTIPDYSGRSITTDESVPISEGGTVTIPAHATAAGSGGNLPAHDLDGPIQIVDAITDSPIGTANVTNPNPFTGGKDAVNYLFVQQADIDNAAKALTNQLTPGVKGKVQSQINKDDRLVHPITCTSNTASNHNAKDEVGSVTVKVSVACNTVVYTDQALQDAATKAYQSDGVKKFGNGYGVVDDMVMDKPTSAGGDGIYLMKIDGIWSYQYTQAHLQEIKQLIAGKKSDDALKLLQARKDIQSVSLKTSGGLGTAVPTTLDNIHLNVAKVNGLHTTV